MDAWMHRAYGSCLWTSLQEKQQRSRRLSRYEQRCFGAEGLARLAYL